MLRSLDLLPYNLPEAAQSNLAKIAEVVLKLGLQTSKPILVLDRIVQLVKRNMETEAKEVGSGFLGIYYLHDCLSVCTGLGSMDERQTAQNCSDNHEYFCTCLQSPEGLEPCYKLLKLLDALAYQYSIMQKLLACKANKLSAETLDNLSSKGA